jgi:hypothetical protein
MVSQIRAIEWRTYLAEFDKVLACFGSKFTVQVDDDVAHIEFKQH